MWRVFTANVITTGEKIAVTGSVSAFRPLKQGKFAISQYYGLVRFSWDARSFTANAGVTGDEIAVIGSQD
jgi:hypothetical protein